MIKKYSYGHLMILEISSDQQKRPAGLIKRETGVNPVRSRHCDSCFSAAYHWKIFSGKVLKVYRLKSGDLLISSKRDSCGRREILIKSYNFMCCITPIAIFAHPRRKNPRTAVYADANSTVPNLDIISG